MNKPNIKVGDFVLNRKFANRGCSTMLYRVDEVTERYGYKLNPVTGKYDKGDLEILVTAYNPDDHHNCTFNILCKNEDWAVIPKEALAAL